MKKRLYRRRLSSRIAKFPAIPALFICPIQTETGKEEITVTENLAELSCDDRGGKAERYRASNYDRSQGHHPARSGAKARCRHLTASAAN